MVFNTISVGTAVTPTVIETYFSHYLNRKPLRQKPTAHVSYHEGLSLIRQFLRYASLHTIEDIQGFTSQWVPTPRWVKVDEVTIPEEPVKRAADAVIAQLGHHGIDRIGGSKWWQWRGEGRILKAEWIEMRSDYARRQHNGDKGTRIMLYVHGGAYFFGSVDEHRYQMQRHARKLNARVFARCVDSYEASRTIEQADCVYMLIICRDQGIPMPAGAVLISPWVDLTHSFPSLDGDSSYDYVPSHGFLQRPSAAWPPPNVDEMADIALHAVEKVVGDDLHRKSTQKARREATEEAVLGFSMEHAPEKLNPREYVGYPASIQGANLIPAYTMPGASHDLSITVNGKMIEVKDQIQMYTTNQLISHPLVSPVLQPSLGGLPPLLILTGGGEILRDEQIYLAHKAANPAQYPPGEAYLDEYPEARELIHKWKPTDVQLQVWEDLCHVAPTLSFTRPAKYMYRSIAQFGAWVLARAQKTEIEILDDDDVSVISEGSDEGTEEEKPRQGAPPIKDGIAQCAAVMTEKVGKAGEPLATFRNHMIRQKVDRHGRIYPLGPPSSLPALQMSANEIGMIKPGPVKRWLNAKKEWDTKFAREKRKIQKQRIKEMARGFQDWGDDDVPPPSALAGRRSVHMPKEEKKGRSWGMSLWSLWGSSHDEKTIEREEKADKEPATLMVHNGATATPINHNRVIGKTQSNSRHRAVTDTGQSADNAFATNENDSAAEHSLTKPDQPSSTQDIPNPDLLSPHLPPAAQISHDRTKSNLTPVETSEANRPIAGGTALPFKLGTHLNADNASMITLTSQAGVVTPKGNEVGRQLGEEVQHSPLKHDVSLVVGAEDGGLLKREEERVYRTEGLNAGPKRPEVERFKTAKEGF